MTVAPVIGSPVSRSQSAATLPEIRTLAPIQPISVPRQHTNESIVTSSSVTSQDTFMTALTSTPSPSSPTTARLNVTSPHSLRKSISVDSFIKNRRSPDLSEPGPSSSVHSRDTTRDSVGSDSGLDPDLEEWKARPTCPGRSGDYSRPSASKSFASRVLGRTRGHSLSGPTVSDYDDPYLDDSEHERATDMAHLTLLPGHRSYSASSPIGKGKARARPGDVLLLPPRKPNLSNASSISSLSSATNGSPFTENVPPVPPRAHLQHRRPNIPGPLVMPHRTRSGSLGANPARQSWATHDDFAIAVVGPPSCGKSTVIRKGLKTWGISEESVCTVATPAGRLRYGSRTINIPLGNQTTRIAHVIELDSDTLSLGSPDGAWPEGLPHIDGVLVCYDASDMASFARIPDLLACYHALHLSAVAMACKCDLDKQVPPHRASDRAAPYNVGLVEVTSATDAGKKKMRNCFNWLLRAIEKAKRGDQRSGSPYRNPASPDVLIAPWADGYGYPETRGGSIRSRTSTPPAGSPSTATKFREHPLATSVMPSSPPAGASTPTPRSPSAPTSPARVKSTSDLLSEVERSRQEERQRDSLDGRGTVMGSLGRVASMSAGSLHETQETLVDDGPSDRNGEDMENGWSGSVDRREGSIGKDNEPPPMPWATLEELLDKLFFLAVSGDDPTFIKHFFLTYRKFATPRSVLLGMQKRVRQLNMEHSDLLLGSYAQMRICDLLEEWTEDYPTDFATVGTSGALTALIKQIISNPRTLHYGSDIIPFIDELPHLQDADASWGIKVENPREESDDDGVGLLEDDEELTDAALMSESPLAAHGPTTAPIADPDSVEPKAKSPSITTRERKGSLPLSTKSMLSTPLTTTLSGSSESSRSNSGKASLGSSKASVKELAKIAQSVAACNMRELAEEITRMQSEQFLAIEPRQWLRYTMGGCRSEEPISDSATFYNHVSNWVSSLILAHERVKHRERQVERFAELARQLRDLNNYVGLRAVMTGISNATFPNDEIMSIFLEKDPELYRKFRGFDILLNSTRNHRAYRMALKNTSGAGIPDMEVHTFDMVRAHDSNPDHKVDDPSKIHWGKFTLMARMVNMITTFQEKIRTTHAYDFQERRWIKDFLDINLMDEDMQQSRVIPPLDDAPDNLLPGQASHNFTNGSTPRPDAARIKRLFFW